MDRGGCSLLRIPVSPKPAQPEPKSGHERKGKPMPRLNLEIANSPWDSTQTCELLAPGVWWVTTDGHGGLMVDAATARETLSKAAIAHGVKWGRFVCYEEDCQYSIAFFERP